MTFKCTIDLDNDAMQDPAALARTLHFIADMLEDHDPSQRLLTQSVRDANGNRVGSYSIVKE